MSVIAQCGCGKRMTLADALAGKTIKCPGCGSPIQIAAAPQNAGKAPVKKEKASPAVYISMGKIIAAVCVVTVITLGILFVTGPVRVWNQWEAIGGKASNTTKDVITFGLQSYLSQNGYYDPSVSNHPPAVDGDILFYRPLLAMSMPEKVKFEGKSTQGDFSGFYYPATGEIEADVSYGGMTVAGMVDLAKSTGSFHMTGRDTDGNPEGECNGKKLEIVYPPKPTDAK